MQIMLANKNSEFADQVAARRNQDFENKTNHQNMVENNRLFQMELNNMRRDQRKNGINEARTNHFNACKTSR